MSNIDTLSVLSPALSQLFNRVLAFQWNRKVVALQGVKIVDGAGKNVPWDAEFPTTETPAAAFAPGSDVSSSEFTYDPDVPATLAWANYRAPTKIEGLAVDAAATSPGSPDILMRLFDAKIGGAISRLIKLINDDFYTGTGTDGNGNQNLIGVLGGALELSGSYAGISRSTYPGWAGNVLSNGGTPRPLTLALLQALYQQILTNSGREPTRILCSYAVHSKYQSLFTPIQRVQTAGEMPQQFGAGTQKLFWNNIPLEPDISCPADKLIMLNNDTIELQALPRAIPEMFETLGEDMTAFGGTGLGPGDTQQPVNLQLRVEVLPKNGDSYPINVWVRVQLRVEHPNANGYIADISPS
jgi:hypothetical protein